jgi:FkbM family methyltransferase
VKPNLILIEGKQPMRRSLKAWTQIFLRRIGLYYRLKSSFLYDLYWRVADRRLVDNRRKEVGFYQEALQGLRKDDLIFDIGANQGQKTDIFLRLGAKVVAVDPDTLNQEVLKLRFLHYRLVRKPVVVVEKAVSERIGSETMWVDEPGSAKNTLNAKWVKTLRTDASRFGKSLEFEEKREVVTTTLEELIRSHGRPFYIKIDVEGHEVSVLKGMQSAVPFLSFEANLPEFKPEALLCIQLLEGVAAGGDFNYVADCLKGLGSEGWLPQRAFVDVLERCQESSIEIFWRAPRDAVAKINGH